MFFFLVTVHLRLCSLSYWQHQLNQK